MWQSIGIDFEPDRVGTSAGHPPTDRVQLVPCGHAPASAVRVNQRTILVSPDAALPAPSETLVSSVDQLRVHRVLAVDLNSGLTVIAVDPAYHQQVRRTEHWLGVLREISADASCHHAAALVIARRGLVQRARQRKVCHSTPAEHRQQMATIPVVRSTVDGQPAVLSEQRMRDTGTRKARGQPYQRCKTRPAS